MSTSPTPQSESIQLLLDEMRDCFIDELPEKINRIELLLLQLEKNKDIDCFNEVYRHVHSLKGSGGTFGLHIITRVCHLAEAVLIQYNDKQMTSPESYQILLHCIDQLRQILLTLKAGKFDFLSVDEFLLKLHNNHQSSSKRILILESSQSLCKYYGTVISSLKINYDIINDGIEGLRQLLTVPYSVLIIARELQVLNGPALLLALRASNHKNADIPAILLSTDNNITLDKRTSLVERTKNHGNNLLIECSKVLQGQSKQ